MSYHPTRWHQSPSEADIHRVGQGLPRLLLKLKDQYYVRNCPPLTLCGDRSNQPSYTPPIPLEQTSVFSSMCV